MRYSVEWWYTAIETWMRFEHHFWFRRSACRYIGKRVVQGYRNARKWRVIDDKTNEIVMTVERIDGKES